MPIKRLVLLVGLYFPSLIMMTACSSGQFSASAGSITPKNSPIEHTYTLPDDDNGDYC